MLIILGEKCCKMVPSMRQILLKRAKKHVSVMAGVIYGYGVMDIVGAVEKRIKSRAG